MRLSRWTFVFECMFWDDVLVRRQIITIGYLCPSIRQLSNDNGLALSAFGDDFLDFSSHYAT